MNMPDWVRGKIKWLERTIEEQTSEHRKSAYKKWGWDAIRIIGDGPHALLTRCGTLMVSLWKTQDEAERVKKYLDTIGCGGKCKKRHEIVDVRQKRITYKYPKWMR